MGLVLLLPIYAMVPASSWIAIVVLAGVALQAVIGLVFVYRQRQHPVIAWRHPIRMAFRTLVLLLWSATNVVGPQSSDSTICSIRVVNAILLWTLLGSVLSQLWFLYVSWSCIAVALADNTVNQVNSKSTLIRYRQVLTSRPLLTTLEVLVIVIGSIPVVSATAASGLTPSPVMPNETWTNRCPGRPGIAVAVILIIYGASLAFFMHNLRNMKDSLGVRKEVRVMFATVITVVVVLIAVSIVPVLGSGSPNALLQLLNFIAISIGFSWACPWLPVQLARATPVTSREMHDVSRLTSSRTSDAQRFSILAGDSTTVSVPRHVKRSSGFRDCMRTQEGAAAFKQFCASEFSVENAAYLEASAQLCLQYGVKPYHSRTSLKDIPDASGIRAEQNGAFLNDFDCLVKTFLVAGASFEGTGRDSTERVQDAVAILYRIDGTICDLLAADTFRRFKDSKIFRDLANE
ncbi:unnamed protein product (mitochondrion) [Plasmodiophora brassicae]|uniref:Uncharacterized protein n=1 Tax=Plasmodiophora brassicae TaxID=37360 RepID=A0A3P3Y722_PLABS|nr:unnamed protein product [Plasmodiophora brassicae]